MWCFCSNNLNYMCSFRSKTTYQIYLLSSTFWEKPGFRTQFCEASWTQPGRAKTGPKVLPKSIGWGREGYRNCWRQPREDIFQRAAKEDEGGGKSDSHNMYVMARCRHRCQNNSLQLKIESRHLATNMRFIFDFEPDWYTNHNNKLNQISTPPAS